MIVDADSPRRLAGRRSLHRLASAGAFLALILSAPVVAGGEDASAGAVAEKNDDAPEFDNEDFKRAVETLQKLADGFKTADVQAISALFSPRLSPEKRRPYEQALAREFAAVEYVEFEVLEVRKAAAISDRKHEVEAYLRIRYVEKNGASSVARHNSQTYVFVFHLQPEGVFFLPQASEFFTQIGRHRSLQPMAWAISAAVALLAALVFWVWMGWEVMRLRPRKPVWRIVVIVCPILGALAFCVFVYLPARFFK
jgi:hypothetical protein